MKCPRCDATLLGVGGDLYECPQCFYIGSFKGILEFKKTIRQVDSIIETKEAEKEYLLDARREAILKGNTVYLQKVLTENSSYSPQVYSSSCPVIVKRKSFRSKLGLMLASVELGAFMSWLLDNFYALMDGKLPLIQGVLPFVFLFQSVILLVVSWD